DLLLENMPVGQKFRALKEIAPSLPQSVAKVDIARITKVLLDANSEVRVHLAHKRFGVGTKDLVVMKSGLRDGELLAWTSEEFRRRIDLIAQTRRPLFELLKVLMKLNLDRAMKDA